MSPLYTDDRGYLFEAFDRNSLDNFVTEKYSYSHKGVLRGMHFQSKHSQAKFVTVVHGAILDGIVDMSDVDPSIKFGAFRLFTGDSIYIPKGFAHGFYALEDSIIHYACSDVRYEEEESGIMWNKYPVFEGVKDPILSEKDKRWPK